MSAIYFMLILWASLTVVYSLLQAIENRRFGRDGTFWAPVWWIALTWPVWLVVIAMDLPWGPHWPRQRANSTTKQGLAPK